MKEPGLLPRLNSPLLCRHSRRRRLHVTVYTYTRGYSSPHPSAPAYHRGERGMSVFVSSWVWKQKMKPTNKLVLLKLADHARDDGTKVFPSVATIATHTGMSERQVQRILKELVEDGVLTIVAHENGGRGR